MNFLIATIAVSQVVIMAITLYRFIIEMTQPDEMKQFIYQVQEMLIEQRDYVNRKNEETLAELREYQSGRTLQ